MGEQYVVLNNRSINYSGVFDANALYDMIQTFLVERGYDKKEKKHEIRDWETDKTIEIEDDPEKNMGRNELFRMKMKIIYTQIKPVEVSIDDEKKTLQSGKFKISVKGILITDEGKQWDLGTARVLRFVADTYIFRSEREYESSMGIKDVEDMMTMILEYFNVHGNVRP